MVAAATRELVQGAAAEHAEWEGLGEHRLKDLGSPQRIFQLRTPELAASFPPLLTLDHLPNNLPSQIDPLVGRECELDELAQLLTSDDVRLLTLTGPGGTGKTRLVLQVAAELLHHYPDGVFFVDLASVRSTEEVPTAVTGTIGLVGAATNTRERLADHLTGKRVLLVLDNFEQVIGSAPWVAQLLSSSTHLDILVTSRESLAVRGEREYAVPALSMPAPSTAAKIDAAGLRQYEAAQLLIDRAVAVKSDFEVTNASAPAVAEICMRLDGLPLAIELAAARLHVLSPEALLERLDSRLAVLRSRRRDVPARQQTLEAALDWSYELLDEEGRRLLHILPVFSGGFTVEAADEVYRRLHPATDTLSVFESLVAKNLVTERADGRFGLLAIIEEYALARVGEGNAEHETRRAHADWCLSLADDAERGMDTIAVDD